jgi:anti-sigma-K factor RskA
VIDVQLHEMIRNDLAEYAFGTLDPQERLQVDEHLSDCDDCREALREYEVVVGLLPLGLPMSEPSPSARSALLARARAERPRRTATRDLLHLPRLWLPVAAIAAALIIAAGFGAWVVFFQGSGSDPAQMVHELANRPGVEILPMVGSDAAPAAVGQLLIEPGQRSGGLIVSGLPTLPNDRVYQFWFVSPDQSRLSGAIFTVSTNGEAAIPVNAPEDFSWDWRCGVTEEPAGGSPTPTGTNVLKASYGSSDSWGP